MLMIRGVGFHPTEGPAHILLSNMHTRNGDPLGSASREFQCANNAFPKEFGLDVIGFPMSPRAKDMADQALDRILDYGKIPSADAVSEVLAGVIEASAGTYVGEQALVTTLWRTGNAGFNVVTPGSRPGQTVDMASPYMVMFGMRVVFPQQMLRRSPKKAD